MPAIVFLAEWVEQWMSEIQQGYADLVARQLLRRSSPELDALGRAGASACQSERSSDRFFHPARLHSLVGQPVFCLTLPLFLSRSAGVLGIESSIAHLQAWKASPRLSLAGFVFEGRTLQVTPNFYAMLGAMPHRPFRFLGREVSALAPLDARWRKIGILARVVTSTSPAQLTAELAKTRNGSHVAIRFLQERMREPLLFTAGAFLLVLASGLAMLRLPWCGAAFFAAKTVLLRFAIAASWDEFVSGFAISPTGGMGLASSLLLPAMLLLAAALALAWSLQDQNRRCPICCRILSMPVRIGSRGSVILDRPCVEILCPRGHGSLLIPDSIPHSAERPACTAFHESGKIALHKEVRNDQTVDLFVAPDGRCRLGRRRHG